MEDLVIRKTTKQTISIVLEYLLQKEFTCISLLSHVLNFKESDNLYYIHNNTLPVSANNITGVILITNYGVILHSIKKATKQLLFPYFRGNLFSFAGTSYGTNVIQSTLAKDPKTIFNYDLLTYNYTNPRSNIKPLPRNYKIEKCSLNDLDKLYFLQYNYQIEEVLPKGKILTEKQCTSLLYERLRNHLVYGIKDENNNFVAIAGTNAIGYNYVQLGGIYTNSNHRKKGLAQNLVKHLVLNCNKKVALFVKKDNISAQKAYKNAGFEPTNIDYHICYI